MTTGKDVLQKVIDRTGMLPEGKPGDIISGKSVEATVRELAAQFGSSIEKEICTRGEALDMSKGATATCLDFMSALADQIAKSEDARIKLVSGIRSIRMAMTTEIAAIEAEMGKLKKMDLAQLTKDLNTLAVVLAKPEIKALLKPDVKPNE